MVRFVPQDGVRYAFDYPAIFRAIGEGKLPATETYRKLCREDLFFLLYFGLEQEYVHKPFVVAAAAEVQDLHENTLDLWAREHFKDLCCQTPVLTANRGWVAHGDLDVGDFVFSPSGSPVQVVATRQYQGGACYRVRFSGGAEIVAGGGHWWAVEVLSRKRKPGGGRCGRVPAVMTTEALARLRQVNRPRIPVTATLQAPTADLPIDPYVLGVWLGDGSNGDGRIHLPDREIWKEIERRGYSVSHNHCPSREPFRASTVYGLVVPLRALGLLHNKHIPEQYLTAAAGQRRDLLWGLVDSDGNVASTRNATVTYASKRLRLAADVMTLAAGLGYKPRLTPSRTTESWQVTFQANANDDHPPCFLSRKRNLLRDVERHPASRHWYVDSITPTDSVPTNCIQVAGADGMYLAGRSLIPTHNSSLLTYGLVLQELIRDPEERVCIFSHTRPIAKQFLRQIKLTLENDTPLRRWFPDVFWAKPKTEAPKWSEDDGLVVRRRGQAKEASVEAWGLVDGQPVSKHFTVRVYDDVVTPASVTTPEQIAKTLEAYELSQSLGTDGGRKRLVGTHYHFADLYMHLRKKEGYTVRLKPATEDGTATGRPVLLSPERLVELRREQGSYVFASQQLLNPVAADNQTFQLSWLQTCFELPARMNRYLLVDPANSKRKDSDYTVMAVIGIDAHGHHFLIDLLRDRLNLGERWTALREMWRRNAPISGPVGYERYGMQADVAYMQERQRSEGCYFPILELGGQTSKEDRIRRLVPVFENRRFYLPPRLIYTDVRGRERDMVKEFVDEEYQVFPYCAHDDILDCLARILDPAMRVTRPMVRAGGRQTQAVLDHDEMAA